MGYTKETARRRWVELDKQYRSEKIHIGRAPKGEPGSWTVQSLVFDNKKFTDAQAKKWISEHEGFVNYDVDETDNTYRFRQYDPEHFSTFRNREMTDGIIAVYGRIAKSECLKEAEEWYKQARENKFSLPRTELLLAVVKSLQIFETDPVPEFPVLKRRASAGIRFVVFEPSEVDRVHGELLTGREGRVFDEYYLAPLGLTRKSICLQSIENRISNKSDSDLTIVLGSKAVPHCRADHVLPHPQAVRKALLDNRFQRAQFERKLSEIKKSIDNRITEYDTNKEGIDQSSRSLRPTEAREATQKNETDAVSVAIKKADAEKQVVYGVVMDPYSTDGATPDAHNDWMSPDIIEQNAWDYMQSEKIVGLQHTEKADAVVLESSVEPYPTPEDRQKAFAGEPHSVTRRPFGSDVVHSGSWILAVQLGDKEWGLYKKGELNAFSPGGFGIRKPIKSADIPSVKFIDLKPVEASNA